MSEFSKPKSVPLKENLVLIVQDLESALVLQQVIYWCQRVSDYDAFLEEERGKEAEELKRHGWIYKSAEQLSEELFDLISASTIKRRLINLVKEGYLDRRKSKNKWDRTYQYRVNLKRIRAAILETGGNPTDLPKIPVIDSDRRNEQSSRSDEQADRPDEQGAGTIPENTDKENTKREPPQGGSATAIEWDQLVKDLPKNLRDIFPRIRAVIDDRKAREKYSLKRLVACLDHLGDELREGKVDRADAPGRLYSRLGDLEDTPEPDWDAIDEEYFEGEVQRWISILEEKWEGFVERAEAEKEERDRNGYEIKLAESIWFNSRYTCYDKAFVFLLFESHPELVHPKLPASRLLADPLKESLYPEELLEARRRFANSIGQDLEEAAEVPPKKISKYAR